jgi:hypothetical protein
VETHGKSDGRARAGANQRPLHDRAGLPFLLLSLLGIAGRCQRREQCDRHEHGGSDSQRFHG